jgi:hypothetical protein
MSTANLPVDVFRLATVRAPRKPLTTLTAARTIKYAFNSALYQTLKTQRTGADARNAMKATAVTFKANVLYIADTASLSTLFPGFELVDDYLRTERKNAVKADLKALVEGVDVLNQTAVLYVGAVGYPVLKSKVWDNLIAQSILGENAGLRTELTRILRLLNIIERIATNDPILNTGSGIYGLYMATVLLPGDVFPLPNLALPAEPTTNPVDNTAQATALNKIRDLSLAYEELKALYDRQNYRYRREKVDVNTQITDPPAEIKLYKHDPLIIDPATMSAAGGVSATTLAILGELKIDRDQVYMPYVHEQIQKRLREQGKIAHATKDKQMVVRFGSSIVRVGNECAKLAAESPCSPFVQYAPWPGGAGHVRPLGIADLKVVKSQLYKYELGEVAHIENILKGETKKRTFRNLDRTETTVVNESETTKEVEKETQTTERFELQKESSNVVQEDQQASLGITASYGFPAGGGISLSTSISSSTSQEQADRQATNYAKDVMERALTRVIERSRTQKTVTTIIEHEDTAEHGFTNEQVAGSPPPENIAGIYRWVDKLFYNKVKNYGRRLMFEFVIPEPAAFHVYSKLVKPATNEAVQMPASFDIQSFADITTDLYDELAIKYGATGVKPPPELFKTVAVTNNIEPPTGDPWHTWGTKVDIPSGYKADNASVRIFMSPGSGMYIAIWVGKQSCGTDQGGYQVELPMDQETGQIAIAARFHSNDYAIAIEIRCSPTAETFQQWQIDTYAQLKTAYEQKVSEYNRWLNQQTVLASSFGTNPALNRHVERQEIKKHCIEFISGQRFESFDAMRTNTGSGYPEFSFAEATNEGKYIQFFEQAYEWEQISYYFYPYFWARKREWVNILKRDENDPLFMNFLQAGAVRVLVPVRPGYEKAMLHYLNTGGEIWNGEDVPAPNDPLYVSIIDEIMEADGYFEGGEDEGEAWLSKVPTSLVYLQNPNTPGDLPDYSADLPL